MRRFGEGLERLTADLGNVNSMMYTMSMRRFRLIELGKIFYDGLYINYAPAKNKIAELDVVLRNHDFTNSVIKVNDLNIIVLGPSLDCLPGFDNGIDAQENQIPLTSSECNSMGKNVSNLLGLVWSTY